MITRDVVLSLLDYDAELGVLTWRHRPRSAFSRDIAYIRFTQACAGKRAGHLRKDGYRYIGILGRRYLEHCVVWLLHTGAWPINEIDHENGNISENRFGNLRDVTHQKNGQNLGRSKANTSGCTGVGWQKSNGQWRARITVNGTTLWLGLFPNKDAAIAARKAAANQHGFHPNHGMRKSNG